MNFESALFSQPMSTPDGKGTAQQFRADDGYEITVRDGVISIAKDGAIILAPIGRAAELHPASTPTIAAPASLPVEVAPGTFALKRRAAK